MTDEKPAMHSEFLIDQWVRDIVSGLHDIARALEHIAKTQELELEHDKRTGPPEFNIEGTPLGNAFKKHREKKR